MNLAEVGDVNGDGYGDVIAGNDDIGTLTLLLGAPGSPSPVVYVHFSPASGLATTPL